MGSLGWAVAKAGFATAHHHLLDGNFLVHVIQIHTLILAIDARGEINHDRQTIQSDHEIDRIEVAITDAV